jgi:transposase
MDDLGSTPVAVKRRRRHSAQFKAMVVKASYEPGNSVAGVAQRFHLNDNLVHKWRRQSRAAARAEPEAFVKLALAPPAATVPVAETAAAEAIRVEIPGATGPIRVHWPFAQREALLPWLKALQA